MPPKSKFNHERIVEAAFQVVCREGIEKLSARTIAKQLNSSTMPIYSYIKSMENLEAHMWMKAGETALKYQTTQYTDDVFLNMEIGYVKFALEERHLFRFINNPKYSCKFSTPPGLHHMEILAQILDKSPEASELTPSQRRLLILKGWIFTHGLADLMDESTTDIFIELQKDEKKLIALIKEVDKDLTNSSHAIGNMLFNDGTGD